MFDKLQKRVAFYIRVSTEEQAQEDKYGKKNQIEALKALVKSKAMSLVFAGDNYIYIDEISGTTDITERPAFRKLIEDITYAPENEKPFDVVAVYKIDRFARKLKVLLEVMDWFDEHKLEFVSAHESIDTSTPFGKAMLGIIGVISELEIANIEDRMRGGKEIAIKEGKYSGRNPPFGYIKDPAGRLTVCENEVAHVKNIFDLFTKETLTTQQIANYLTENKILSPAASAVANGKLNTKKSNKKYKPYFWQERTVRRILSEDIYIGDYYYYKTKTIKKKQTDLPKDQWKLSDYHHEAIVDKFQFMRAQEIINDTNKNKSNYGVSGNKTYLLSGLIKCANCFVPEIDTEPQSWIGYRKEVGKGSGKFSYSYICRRKNKKNSTVLCGALPLPAEQVENYVLKFIKNLFNNPIDTFNYYKDVESSKAERKELERKLKDLNRNISQYTNTKEALREQHKNGIISIHKLKSELEDLDKRHRRNTEEQNNISHQLAPLILDEGYNTTFEIFKKKYAKKLDGILMEQRSANNLLKLVIQEVIVASRDLNSTDIIAGKRKADQKIPYKILIKLRLPKEIIRGLHAQFHTGDANEKIDTSSLIEEVSSGQTDTNGARGQT